MRQINQDCVSWAFGGETNWNLFKSSDLICTGSIWQKGKKSDIVDEVGLEINNYNYENNLFWYFSV